MATLEVKASPGPGAGASERLRYLQQIPVFGLRQMVNDHFRGDEGEARLAAAPAKPTLNGAAQSAADAPAPASRPNPLKEHLVTHDRLELLKQHVEAGSDQDKLRVEVEKADPLAFTASLDAFALVDTLRDLRALTMPAVLVYGDRDSLFPVPAETTLAALTDGRGTFGVMSLAGTRHFPMLEDGAAFSRLLMAFLEAPDVTKIAQKDLWVRRVR